MNGAFLVKEANASSIEVLNMHANLFRISCLLILKEIGQIWSAASV